MERFRGRAGEGKRARVVQGTDPDRHQSKLEMRIEERGGMRIYFIGICGTAMGNAALLLRNAGHVVAGSDTGVYPPMSEVLANAGVCCFEGFEAGRPASWGADLVVVGNAVARGNPEFESLLSSRQTPFTSLPALLHDHVLKNRRNIVVTGTHGKTTTASMAALLLRANGCGAGWFIGGVPRDLPGGAFEGDPAAPFVIEGDEYDSALFDKRSKFIHYAPHIATINNLEFDHADIFRDLPDVQRAFDHFLRVIPGNGYLLLNGDDPAVMELARAGWTTTFTVGTGKSADLAIRDFEEGPEGARFDLVWGGRFWGKVEWKVTGLFNARNGAMAALAAGLALHPPDVTQLNLGALCGYKGVRRRQEVLLELPSITVMEDFGHHPTAVKHVLASLRKRKPGSFLRAVFEPRSNTSRRNILQAELTEALGQADAAYLGPVDRPHKLAEADRLDPDRVARDLRSKGVHAASFASHGEVLHALKSEVRTAPGAPPQIIVFFTNGSMGGIMPLFVRALREKTV